MNLNPPSRVRAVLYVVTAIGTPFVAYLLSKGKIGDVEVALWSAEVTVVSLLAGFNVTKGR